MPKELYQIINIDYAAVRKTFRRPPKVCDISPGVAVQVLNFVGLEPAEIEHAIRNGETWDVTTQGAILSAVSEHTKG